jgi:hypothetical protein
VTVETDEPLRDLAAARLLTQLWRCEPIANERVYEPCGLGKQEAEQEQAKKSESPIGIKRHGRGLSQIASIGGKAGRHSMIRRLGPRL